MGRSLKGRDAAGTLQSLLRPHASKTLCLLAPQADGGSQAPAGADCSDATWEAFASAAATSGSGPSAGGAPAGEGAQVLRARFAALQAYQQAAALQADPVQHITRLLQVDFVVTGALLAFS